MRSIKALLLTVWTAGLVWQTHAAESNWLTDLPQAEARATAEHKIVLLDFTGSDWCSWCIKFRKEVLDTPAFQAYAATNVVLVEVDFPNHKEQSASLKAANDGLKSKFSVHGFPTLLVLDEKGQELGRQVGYEKGGPSAFIAKLDQFKAGK